MSGKPQSLIYWCIFCSWRNDQNQNVEWIQFSKVCFTAIFENQDLMKWWVDKSFNVGKDYYGSQFRLSAPLSKILFNIYEEEDGNDHFDDDIADKKEICWEPLKTKPPPNV